MNAQRNRLLLERSRATTAREEDAQLPTGGRLILHKNALVFNGRAFQVSSICSVGVSNRSLVRQHPMPGWVAPVGLLGISAALCAVAFQYYATLIIGFGFVAIACNGFRNWRPEERIRRYALCVEMPSGTKSLLCSSDEAFLLHAAQVITAAIADKANLPPSIEINFDNKTTNVGQAFGSTIVGGNLNIASGTRGES